VVVAAAVLEALQVEVLPSLLPDPAAMVETLMRTPQVDLEAQRIQQAQQVQMALVVAVVVGVSRLALQQVLAAQAVREMSMS
jgi:hypothetical protein